MKKEILLWVRSIPEYEFNTDDKYIALRSQIDELKAQKEEEELRLMQKF